MIQTTITVSGTIKHPETKQEVEKFTFDVTVPMPEDLAEAMADEADVWKKYYLQTKIDHLNHHRTAYINKRLAELGYAKPKAAAISPEMRALVNKLLNAKQTNPTLYADISAALAAQGITI